mgnify:CR=1 FL=1
MPDITDYEFFAGEKYGYVDMSSEMAQFNMEGLIGQAKKVHEWEQELRALGNNKT